MATRALRAFMLVIPKKIEGGTKEAAATCKCIPTRPESVAHVYDAAHILKAAPIPSGSLCEFNSYHVRIFPPEQSPVSVCVCVFKNHDFYHL
ncbi:hypothetical protein FKM82_027391 [Ascaphus truei]